MLPARAGSRSKQRTRGGNRNSISPSNEDLATRRTRSSNKSNGTSNVPTGPSGRHSNFSRASTASSRRRSPSTRVSKQETMNTTSRSDTQVAKPRWESPSDRYQRLKGLREKEREDAIRDNLFADPNQPRALSKAITIVGTCQDMCPEFERVERIVQQDVWAPERQSKNEIVNSKPPPDETKMVKKFRRAAAGMEEQLPSDLRPPLILKKTIDYLFGDLLHASSSLEEVHHFIWDRTRAVRNDFSIQQIRKVPDVALAVECCERIARFHILCLHQFALPQKPYDSYDAQQEREQLNKTLLSLTEYYDDFRGVYQSPNEAEFRAYGIIHQIKNSAPNLEERLLNWPRHIATDERVLQALKLYAIACNAVDTQGPLTPWTNHSVALADWRKFWSITESDGFSFLMSCMAEIYFNYVRHIAMHSLWQAYRQGRNQKSDDWTLSELVDVLGFDDEEETRGFCEQYGFTIVQKANGEYSVDLNSVNRNSFPESPLSPHQAKRVEFLEFKRHGRSVSDIIDGVALDSSNIGSNDDDFAPTESTSQNNRAREESLFIPQDDDEDSKETTSFQTPRQDPNPDGDTEKPKLSPNHQHEPHLRDRADAEGGINPIPASFASHSTTPLAKPRTGTSALSSMLPLAPWETVQHDQSKNLSQSPFTTNATAFGSTSRITSTTLTSESPFTSGNNTSTQSRGNTNFSRQQESGFSTNSVVNPIFNKNDATPIPVKDTGFSSQLTTNGDFTWSNTATPKDEKKTDPQDARSFFAAPPASQSFDPQRIASTSSRMTDFSSTRQHHETTAFSKPLATTPETTPSILPTSSNYLQALFPKSTNAPGPLFTSHNGSTTNLPTTDSTYISTAVEGKTTSIRQSGPADVSKTVDEAKTMMNPLHVMDSGSFNPTLPATDPLMLQQLEKQQKENEIAVENARRSSILDQLARTMMLEPNGFLEQFVEFIAEPMIKEAEEKIQDEGHRREAEDFRRNKLARRFASRWREKCWNRRLLRQRKERRQRLASERKAKSRQTNGLSLASRLDSYRATTNDSREASTAKFASDRNPHPEQDQVHLARQSNLVSSAIDEHKLLDNHATPNRQTQRLPNNLLNNTTTTSLPQTYENSSGTKRNSNTGLRYSAHNGNSGTEIFSKSTGDSSHQNDTCDTTRSTYFKLKAMGVGNSPESFPHHLKIPNKKRPQSDVAEASLNSSEKRRRLSPELYAIERVESYSSRDQSRQGVYEGDEELFAAVRSAKEAMNESISFFREESGRADGSSPREMSSYENQRVQMSHNQGQPDLSKSQTRSSTQVSSNPPKYRSRISKFLPRDQYADVLRQSQSKGSHGKGLRSKEQIQRNEHTNARHPVKNALVAATGNISSSSKQQPIIIEDDDDDERYDESNARRSGVRSIDNHAFNGYSGFEALQDLDEDTEISDEDSGSDDNQAMEDWVQPRMKFEKGGTSIEDAIEL